LLRVIAGLEVADAGRVRLAGRDIGQLSPQQRQSLYLYQEALLFPHLDVLENIAFGLRLRRCPQRELRAICSELLAQLELEGLEQRMPEQLSGGQRQRVAFGRALAVRPQLLLDEPFGSLDAQTRSSMQMLFQRVAAQYGMTTVFVTHDIQEALRVGDCWKPRARPAFERAATRSARLRRPVWRSVWPGPSPAALHPDP
jgi:ABC-type sulfate/molybdate transport systems ATPase subunit